MLRRGWLAATLVVAFLLLHPCDGATKKQTHASHQAEEEAKQRERRYAFESLGISHSDIDKMVQEVKPPRESPPLTPGDEYVEEPKPEEITDEYREADVLFQAGLKQIERGRPGGADARAEAYKMFDLAAEKGHRDAKKVMAYAHLFGDRARWSTAEARTLFTELATHGSPDAQVGLAFMHATGYGMQTSNQAKALVYYTFAAYGGSTLAQMALGYRYYYGIGLDQKCEQALHYYEMVATKVAESVKFSTGISIQRIRLTDELEPTTTSQSATPMDQNLLEYYKFLADKGDVSAQIGLGQIYLTGGRGIEQNYDEANRYLTASAEAGNAGAFALLGKMYLDGTPVTPQDNVSAFHFFLKAAEKSNPTGQAGLGIMYLQGRGVRKDYDKASRLFTMAADQGNVDGQLHLGIMAYQGLGQARDFKKAVKMFTLATQNGHILAFYNLAQMHQQGLGVPRSCTTAVEFFKNVAERGRWTERMMEAYTAYKERRYDEAALKYLFMAELGYEQAQSNFAYIIDRDEARALFPEAREELLERALVHWRRAAQQEYALARVKLGDYYYYGYGTKPDMTEAANQYKIAADRHLTAQAMFNLGYMHENGLGLAQDLHLAKRNYDMAAEHSPDAFVPVSLALLKLGLLFAVDYASKSEWGEFAASFEHWDLVLMGLSAGCIFGLLLLLLRRRRQLQHENHLHQD